MKKILLSAIALSLSVSVAQAYDHKAKDGFYTQLDAGASRIETKQDGEKDTSGHFSPRISIGYKENDLRFAIDYQHFDSTDEENYYTDGFNTTHEKIKSNLHSFGASLIYDFENESGFTPYVGARISQNKLKLKGTETTNGITSTNKLSKTTTGYGAVAGINYNVTENFAIGLNLEYNYLGKFKFGEEKIRAHQFGVNTGIRITY